MSPPTEPIGLSVAEATQRLAVRGPLEPLGHRRSYRSIVRANVFTVFNVVLTIFGVITLIFGQWQDALFLGIVVINSLIGIVQEMRAKRALDSLAVLVAPTATVLRDGNEQRLPREQIVEGDVIALQAGDQLIGDGRVEACEGLLLDESILSGESSLVPHAPGDELHSGSFVVEGSARYTLTAVGAGSYAAKITGEATAFRHPRSPLERAMNRLLYSLLGAMLPLGALIGYALWERQEPIRSAVSTSVAAVVTLVPEGLILLLSLTFAISAMRLARRGALAQQLNAIESLASVDVVCIDKTGTLTDPHLRVTETIAVADTDEELNEALGRFAANAGAKNATLQAIADRFPVEPGTPQQQEVPFSSRLRWSGLRLDEVSLVLGAPELLPLDELEARAEQEARSGRRVVALARTSTPFGEGDLSSDLPHGLVPLGLVVLAERLRPDAASTIEFFQSQGVALKVLSGDRPETVAAIAADVGIPVGAGAFDGRSLPAGDEALRDILRDHNVIGRISPDGKRRVIEVLRADGHYVAMVGDGVNDVPALKAAQLAMAQGSGVQMARSVADLVLVHSDFSVVPQLVAEGRRILSNLQSVTKLFATKSCVAAFMILVIGISPTAYPLLPRHISLIGALAIGVPSFFLALAPSKDRVTFDRFLREIAHFAVPAGTAIGLGVVASFQAANQVVNLPLLESRTIATTVMALVSLYLIIPLEAGRGRRGFAALALSLVLAGVYVAVLLLPSTRTFFALAKPNFAIVLISALGCLTAIGGLVLSSDRFLPEGGRPAVKQ